MPDNERMSIAMGAVRDQILALIAQHERDDHGGEPCLRNRADAIGFLAHCLGVRGEVPEGLRCRVRSWRV